MKMPAPEQHVDYEPCPAGTHAAVCSRLIDLGTQKTSFQGQTKYQRKIYLEWELPAERMSDGRPFAVGQRYTFSSSPKATLRQHLEAWRGRRFEDEEIEGFELRDVLRKPCLINVVHQNAGRSDLCRHRQPFAPAPRHATAGAGRRAGLPVARSRRLRAGGFRVAFGKASRDDRPFARACEPARSVGGCGAIRPRRPLRAGCRAGRHPVLSVHPSTSRWTFSEPPRYGGGLHG